MVDNTYRRRPGLHPAVIALSYIMIVAAPLILAVSTGRTVRGLIKDFAHAIGMIAYAMLLAQFVLSSRFEAVSGHIGIDVLMCFHQLAARTLAVLIVLHPILMTGRVDILDVYEAPNYFLSIVQNPKFLTGIIAFLLVLNLIATSLGRRCFKIPYEIWRALHGLLALGIAGGVGIAPILSILRYLRATNDPRPIHLIYGAKKKNKLISVKEIEKMKIALDLQTTYALFDPPINWPGKSGNITHDMIRTAINFPTPSTALYFLCGPPQLIETAEECLLKMNVPLNQIIYERFTFD
ncbi:MAG: ferric reductase-like transmembrane domain-containing protein [Rhodospirillales bacterium]